MKDQRQITTYSMWSSFRNCRRACKYRYFDRLAPLEKAGTLRFGSVIHSCLEVWHKTRNMDAVLAVIEAGYSKYNVPDAEGEAQRAERHLALAMMNGYARAYPEEDFRIVALEHGFQGPILNPLTGAESRSFLLAGKVDGIVRMPDGSHYLLEHKTASQIDGSYLERLWTDFQITLYSGYLEKTLGVPITGIIYNVLTKAKLRQGKGETEDEYQTRRNELIAKSRTGKTTARRKLPETDEEFQARLAEKYAEPAAFHREILFLSRDRFTELQSELWELSQALLDARRRKAWYRNTSQCFQYGRPCAYWPICSSGENPLVIENQFQIVEPHEELRDDANPSFTQ
jgi:hypothetical protein